MKHRVPEYLKIVEFKTLTLVGIYENFIAILCFKIQVMEAGFKFTHVDEYKCLSVFLYISSGKAQSLTEAGEASTDHPLLAREFRIQPHGTEHLPEKQKTPIFNIEYIH